MPNIFLFHYELLMKFLKIFDELQILNIIINNTLTIQLTP